jgi:hypothetical protein
MKMVIVLTTQITISIMGKKIGWMMCMVAIPTKKCGRVGDDKDDGDDAGELQGQEKGGPDLDGSGLNVRTLSESDGDLVR